MQVAKKRIPKYSVSGEVSQAEKAQARSTEPIQPNMQGVLTDRRSVYEATGNGTHLHEPVILEDAGQPTPFLSMSWEHWLEVREQIIRNLERFVCAAQEQRADKVLSAGMDMQVAMSRIFLEAYVISTDLGLKELPRRD